VVRVAGARRVARRDLNAGRGRRGVADVGQHGAPAAGLARSDRDRGYLVAGLEKTEWGFVVKVRGEIQDQTKLVGRAVPLYFSVGSSPAWPADDLAVLEVAVKNRRQLQPRLPSRPTRAPLGIPSSRAAAVGVAVTRLLASAPPARPRCRHAGSSPQRMAPDRFLQLVGARDR
jgi:hypothetical protein